jgi:hypothetical protein
MLRRLFTICGFQWGIRISGFICFALCSIACCTVSSRLSRVHSTQPWFQLKHFRDMRFMLMVVACIFISLGTLDHNALLPEAHRSLSSQVSSRPISTSSITQFRVTSRPQPPFTSSRCSMPAVSSAGSFLPHSQMPLVGSTLSSLVSSSPASQLSFSGRLPTHWD